MYTRFNYGSTTVRQQIAPSGIFGTPFMTPLYNPFISADAQADILAAGNAGVANGTVLRATDPGGSDFFNWVDNNGDGAVDGGDELALTYFRRTAEFAPRSSNYDNENWQLLLGTQGLIAGDWEYDVGMSYGETNRILVDGGYTNVTNLGNALRTDRWRDLRERRPELRADRPVRRRSARSRRRWRPTQARRRSSSRLTSS